MVRKRKAKRQFVRKPAKSECECKTRSGVPKTLFFEHWQASRTAGDTMDGKMWQVYKCPDSDGWHITTVRWNPWNSSVYQSQEGEL